MRNLITILVIVNLALVLGCSEEGEEGWSDTDAGGDTESDTGSDTGFIILSWGYANITGQETLCQSASLIEVQSHCNCTLLKECYQLYWAMTIWETDEYIGTNMDNYTSVEWGIRFTQGELTEYSDMTIELKPLSESPDLLAWIHQDYPEVPPQEEFIEVCGAWSIAGPYGEVKIEWYSAPSNDPEEEDDIRHEKTVQNLPLSWRMCYEDGEYKLQENFLENAVEGCMLYDPSEFYCTPENQMQQGVQFFDINSTCPDDQFLWQTVFDECDT